MNYIYIFLAIGLLLNVVGFIVQKKVLGEIGMIVLWTGILTGFWRSPIFGQGISEGLNPGLVTSLLLALIVIGFHLLKIAKLLGWIDISKIKKKDGKNEENH